jgi:hypothetical protein
MAKHGKHCEVGSDQRCRDLDGEIRRKRGDTLVGTLRQTYGPDFAPGARSDMRLDTLLDRTVPELNPSTNCFATAENRSRSVVPSCGPGLGGRFTTIGPRTEWSQPCVPRDEHARLRYFF